MTTHVFDRAFIRSILSVGSFMFCGDAAAQRLEANPGQSLRAPHDHIVMLGPHTEWNVSRSLRTGFVGLCSAGPLSHATYVLCARYIPGRTWSQIGKKLLVCTQGRLGTVRWCHAKAVVLGCYCAHVALMQQKCGSVWVMGGIAVPLTPHINQCPMAFLSHCLSYRHEYTIGGGTLSGASFRGGRPIPGLSSLGAAIFVFCFHSGQRLKDSLKDDHCKKGWFVGCLLHFCLRI